jgi:hypothetical protein
MGIIYLNIFSLLFIGGTMSQLSIYNNRIEFVNELFVSLIGLYLPLFTELVPS